MRNTKPDRPQDSLLRDESQAEEQDHGADTESFSDSEVGELLYNLEFQRTLNSVSQSVFKKFDASPKYSEWEVLRQDILFVFVVWSHKYKGTAPLKSVVNRIATNLCIDEYRRQDAKIRAHVEIDFEELNLETLRSPSAEDINARIMFAECRNRLSGVERDIFDEFFTEGWTLTEIARRHNFSPQTAVNKMSNIVKELRQFAS